MRLCTVFRFAIFFQFSPSGLCLVVVRGLSSPIAFQCDLKNRYQPSAASCCQVLRPRSCAQPEGFDNKRNKVNWNIKEGRKERGSEKKQKKDKSFETSGDTIENAANPTGDGQAPKHIYVLVPALTLSCPSKFPVTT